MAKSAQRIIDQFTQNADLPSIKKALNQMHADSLSRNVSRPFEEKQEINHAKDLLIEFITELENLSL